MTLHPSYLRLLKTFPLASIRDDEQLDAATKVAHKIFLGREFSDLDEGETMYLDALSDLMWVYEQE